MPHNLYPNVRKKSRRRVRRRRPLWYTRCHATAGHRAPYLPKRIAAWTEIPLLPLSPG